MTTPPNLSREEAAAWFAAKGYKHVTVDYLRRAALGSKGPAQHRLGKFVYYAVTSLEAWLEEEIARGERGRLRGRRPAA